ncbi:MAG: hypothetical protein BWY23_01705 [Spirochaetes bacterium ADurb.Bin218]|nr:MAG: hypothetical protein BWY23_01705 [Spirochaetes bacterium ADurb.Bin218]
MLFSFSVSTSAIIFSKDVIVSIAIAYARLRAAIESINPMRKSSVIFGSDWILCIIKYKITPAI